VARDPKLSPPVLAARMSTKPTAGFRYLKSFG